MIFRIFLTLGFFVALSAPVFAASKPGKNELKMAKRVLQRCTNYLPQIKTGAMSPDMARQRYDQYLAYKAKHPIAAGVLSYRPTKKEAPYLHAGIRADFENKTFGEMVELCDQGMLAGEPYRIFKTKKASKPAKVSNAVRKLRHSVERQPSNADEHYNLALQVLMEVFPYIRNGRTDSGRTELLKESEKHFRKAIALYDGHGRAHIMLGVLLMNTARSDAALEHLNVGLELPEGSEDWLIAHENLGRLYIGKEQYAKSKPHWKAILKHNPKSDTALYFLGGCYAQLGQKAKARDHYKKALAINPRHPHARSGLRELDR